MYNSNDKKKNIDAECTFNITAVTVCKIHVFVFDGVFENYPATICQIVDLLFLCIPNLN